MLLLIVPGIIASIRYSMTFFILIDNPNMTGQEAIDASCAMMEGHKWDFFCLMCRFIGWSILCLLTCGIGYFFLYPYIMAAQYEFYKQIK